MTIWENFEWTNIQGKGCNWRKDLREKRMHYDQMRDQWCLDLAGRKYGLHCGESFELYIGRKAIPCQLELDSKWYVIMGEIRLDLRGNDQYKVNI
jgi:hypothetical protein